MRDRWIRFACIALLGLMVGSAIAGVAKASAALEHACCAGSASPDDVAPTDDCHGFLPFSCCDEAALPASDGANVAQAVAAPAALSIALPIPASAPGRFAPPADVSARSSPVRLSVVRQV